MELNPNNPVTKQMHDNWHAVVAVLLQQMGVTEFEITPEMLTRLSASNRLAVVADARGGISGWDRQSNAVSIRRHISD